MRLAFVLVGVGCSLIACHKPAATGGDDDDTMIDGSTSGGSDSGIPADFTMLIQRSWTVVSDDEAYKCVVAQVPNDMWISAFRSLAPTGTHHTVLTILPGAQQPREYDCSVSAGTFGSGGPTQMLYAAGINTDDNALPDGVAIHIPAGAYIHLNLHLYNTTDGDLTQTSGIYVKTIAAADVVNEADMMFAGTMNINIPNNGQDTVATGGCAATTEYHMFTMWPHMHQYANHQKLELTRSGTSTAIPLLDVDYDFNEQKNYPMADTTIHVGDRLKTTCTYMNPVSTGHAITWGDSSDAEMCFTGIYRYPAAHNLFGCES